MLPTHRTMKNGRGDFYSVDDDKYEKTSSKNYIKRVSLTLFLFEKNVKFIFLFLDFKEI